MSEKELTPEELEQAAGGRRTKKANQSLGNAGTAEPTTPSSGGGIVSNVEPLPDPPFQS